MHLRYASTTLSSHFYQFESHKHQNHKKIKILKVSQLHHKHLMPSKAGEHVSLLENNVFFLEIAQKDLGHDFRWLQNSVLFGHLDLNLRILRLLIWIIDSCAETCAT